MHHLKFLAVAKVEAARPVHLAEFVHLPEASAISLPTEIKLPASTTARPPARSAGSCTRCRCRRPWISARALGRAEEATPRSRQWNGVAVDRRGKRKWRNFPGVCLAL